MPGFDLFSGWSYLGIVVFLILTGCGFPLPEEVAFVYAGVQSAVGHLNWGLALAACGIGALLGDSVMYGIGRLGRGWIGRHAWFSRIVHLEREEQVRRLIARHGIKVFFAARFMVGIRGPLYVTLGILKVPFWRFLVVDTICASAVIGVFFSLSYYFGQRVLEWIRRGEYLITALVLIGIVVGGVLWFLHYRRQKHATLEEPPAPNEPEPIAAVTESLLGVAHEELVRESDGPNGSESDQNEPSGGHAENDHNADSGRSAGNGQHRPGQQTLSPTSGPD
ncbi:MAG: hypothetical protein DCC68_19710 [Planctomycetota bacterium]|nr:MAG: hypothetical protein DCC68_19710 [Planctomycetota bacterium]